MDRPSPAGRLCAGRSVSLRRSSLNRPRFLTHRQCLCHVRSPKRTSVNPSASTVPPHRPAKPRKRQHLFNNSLRRSTSAIPPPIPNPNPLNTNPPRLHPLLCRHTHTPFSQTNSRLSPESQGAAPSAFRGCGFSPTQPRPIRRAPKPPPHRHTRSQSRVRAQHCCAPSPQAIIRAQFLPLFLFFRFATMRNFSSHIYS